MPIKTRSVCPTRLITPLGNVEIGIVRHVYKDWSAFHADFTGMNLGMYSIRFFDIEMEGQGRWRFEWKVAVEVKLSTCNMQKLALLGSAVWSLYNRDLDENWPTKCILLTFTYECFERLWLTLNKAVWMFWAVVAYIEWVTSSCRSKVCNKYALSYIWLKYAANLR